MKYVSEPKIFIFLVCKKLKLKLNSIWFWRFLYILGCSGPRCTQNHHLNLNSTYCARPRYSPSSSRWLESRSRVAWTLEAELSEAALFADLSSSRSVLPSAMVEAQASKNRIFLWNWLDSPCPESSWDNNYFCVTFC